MGNPTEKEFQDILIKAETSFPFKSETKLNFSNFSIDTILKEKVFVKKVIKNCIYVFSDNFSQ